MSSNLETRMRNLAQCRDHANQSTYFGCSIEQMDRDELLAVIGHMAIKTDRTRQQQADYIHSSSVARPVGGLSPRSPTLR